MTHLIHAPRLSEIDSIRHGFFTREGGVSEGIYASLQCGRGATDDPRENVAENRALAAKAMKVKRENLVSCYQHHSADVVVVEAPSAKVDAGFPSDGATRIMPPWRPGKPPKADAMVTRTPSIALGILTADCAPVLFAEPGTGIIGAAHAGWKGALGGVLEATVEAMIALGVERQRIHAGIGPCITQPNYQVDTAYRDRFLAADPANAAHFRPDAEDDRFRFDLPAFCRARLKAAGVRHTAFSGHCTYADEARFYSNRRALHKDEGDYGRGLSAIIIK